MACCVYYADISSINPEQYYPLLSGERLLKAQKLKRKADKKRSVGAALLLKAALKDAGAQEGEILLSKNGKPYLKNGGVHFNLSHSGDLVICAVSKKGEVGCDVEIIASPDYRVAQKYFKKGEKSALFSLKGEDEKINEFYRLWVQKESIIKAQGGSLSELKDAEIPDGYKVFAVKLTDGYKCAVCTADSEIKVIKISF